MQFHYQPCARISKIELRHTAKTLAAYRDHLLRVSRGSGYQEAESSIHLPFDDALVKNIRTAMKRLNSPTLQYVIVVGIGGSNMGAQAIYEAVAGSMNLLMDRLPKLIFLDTVADEKITALTQVLGRLSNREDFLIIVISKSGTTVETIANTEVMWSFLEKGFGDPRDRFVIITDEGSKLWDMAKQKKIERLAVPVQVGGRFSVFSSVGLLPLTLGRIDIEELRAGARGAIADGTADDLDKNHSIVSACLTYLHTKQGRAMHNTFFFSPKFEGLGKWYRQLAAESLCKEEDLNGGVVHSGITPMVSIGSTDLHSMAQRYWAGPDDLFTNFVFSWTSETHIVPRDLAMPGLVSHIQGRSLGSIMQAIYGGVKTAYDDAKRPYVEIDLEQANAFELGYYLQFRMLEVMYLGRLMNVNTFNEPAVGIYKEATRQILKKRKV